MSIGKRIWDLARSNLNSLLDKAAEKTDPRRILHGFSDSDLQAELNRRIAERQAEAELRKAKEKITGNGARMPRDRAERERMARERAEKVRAARDARERASRARSQSSQGSSRRASGNSAGSRFSGFGFGSRKDPKLAKHYKVLEVPYGAEWSEIRSSYRRLMRKYHPDLHRNNPAKLKAATEVSVALTTAYNELEKALLGGPNRK